MDSSRRNGNRFVTSASFGEAGLAAKWNSIDRLGLQSTLSLSLSLSLFLSCSAFELACSFGIEDTETAMIFVVPPGWLQGGARFSGMRFCWQVFRCDRVHAYSGMKLGQG